MRAFVLFIGFLLYGAIGIAQQEESLILEGRVEEGTVRAIVHKNVRDSYLPLEGVIVTILNEDVLVKTLRTDTAGAYRVALFPDKKYTINFHQEGYLDKVFVIDGRKYNQSNNRAHMLNSDVALFRDLGSDELRTYVQIPSAKCKYFRNRKEFRWDMTYSVTQQKHFLKLLEEATIATIDEE